MAESSSAVAFITFIGVLMITSGVAGGLLAGFKNRDYSFWIAWTFLFPPSLLILAMLPRHKGPRPHRPSLAEEERRFEDV
jgi:hypothetical protein